MRHSTAARCRPLMTVLEISQVICLTELLSAVSEDPQIIACGGARFSFWGCPRLSKHALQWTLPICWLYSMRITAAQSCLVSSKCSVDDGSPLGSLLKSILALFFRCARDSGIKWLPEATEEDTVTAGVRIQHLLALGTACKLLGLRASAAPSSN